MISIHSNRTQKLISLCTIILLAGFARAQKTSTALPRYLLKPAEQLTYSFYQTRTGKEISFKSSGKIELTVLCANHDGSWHLLLRTVSTDTDISNGNRVTQADGSRIVDVFPDGHAPEGGFVPYENPSCPIFPSLPASEAEIQNSWQEAISPIEDRNYSKTNIDAEQFLFAYKTAGSITKLYAIDESGTYSFDCDKGIVTGIRTHGAHNWYSQYQTSDSTQLENIKQLDQATFAQIVVDANNFSHALKQGNAIIQRAFMPQLHQLAPAIQQEVMRAVLTSGAQIKTDFLKAALSDQANRLASSASMDFGEAIQRRNLVGRPSPEWSSTDLDGHPQSLSAYRGKVVVLDFGARTCTWCMYGIPQIKRLAQDYKDKGVVVLGMSCDPQDSWGLGSARFVSQTFALPYTTVRAANIYALYGEVAFPSLIIIDQLGFIRQYYAGYTPELGADARKVIDSLLKKTS